MDSSTMTIVLNELEKRNQENSLVAIKHISEKEEGTCDLCRTFDGRIFKIPEEKNAVPMIPLHPNCKCRQVEIHSEEEYKRLTEIKSVVTRVDNSPGLGGIRISGWMICCLN